MTGPFLTILDFVIRVFALFCLLRLLLQISGANFYSPIVNSILKITNPVLHPLRSFLPRSKRIDVASLIVVWLLHAGSVAITLFRQSLMNWSNLGLIFWEGLVNALNITIWVYLVAILVSAVMSWIAPNVYSPAAELSRQISEPLLSPLRKFMPPMAGFDFSPMLGVLLLMLINIYVLPLLRVVPA